MDSSALSLYLIFATILSGIIAAVFVLKEERLRRQLHERDRLQRHKYYEVAIMKEIQDRVGYSLDLEKVIEVIQGSLKYFLSYTTTSALIIKDDKVVFKTLSEEPVNPLYLEQVKNNMLASITTITDRPLPMTIEDQLTGTVKQQDQNAKPLSSFHIPLYIHSNVVALVNVSSVKPGLYTDTEITALTQIANQASKAISKLQEVLSIEKEKLMAMIGSLVDGVFMIDTNNQLLVINDAAKRYLQLSLANPTFSDVLSSLASSIDLRGRITESITENKVITENEVLVNGKTMQLVITPVLKPTQTGVYYTKEQERHGVIGASIIIHDVTLEKSVAKMKEDFTNMIVHELRAPLTAMKDSAHLLLTMDNLDTDEKQKLLTIIKSQSGRLLEDVSSLLDAAKLEAGRFTIEKTPGDIKAVIMERLQFFKPQAQSKRIQLKTDIDQHLPAVSFDALRMTQVLNNLLSNSLKYTPEHGEILVRVKADRAGISLAVSDTGIGIPKERQSVLFSKFGQIMHAVGKEGKHLSGTGLGLYITKGIIEAHGGTVILQSEEKKGTTVTFTLPLTLDNSTAVPHTPAAEQTMPSHPVHKTNESTTEAPLAVSLPHRPSATVH